MHHIRASEIPMADRLPRLRAYLTQARREVADPATDGRRRARLLACIVRIEADLAIAADTEEG